jgi:hypothetical protein
MITRNIVEIDNPRWQERALCKDKDPGIFFGGHRTEAKAICNQCPVIKDCLPWILKLESEGNQLPAGVYAATTAAERSKIKLCALEGCYEQRLKDKGSHYRYCSVEHQEESLKIQRREARERLKIRNGASVNPKTNNNEYYLRGRFSG